MRTILALLLCLGLSCCVSNPSVTVVSPDGTKTTLTTGQNLMAEVDEQVSEVEGNGFHLRQMVKRQDATRVPIAFAQTIGTMAANYLVYLDRLEQEVTSRLAAHEITKREAQAQFAAIEQARIEAQSKEAAGKLANEAALINKKP